MTAAQEGYRWTRSTHLQAQLSVFHLQVMKVGTQKIKAVPKAKEGSVGGRQGPAGREARRAPGTLCVLFQEAVELLLLVDVLLEDLGGGQPKPFIHSHTPFQ